MSNDSRPRLSAHGQGGRVAVGAGIGGSVSFSLIDIIMHYLPHPEALTTQIEVVIGAVVAAGVAYAAGRLGYVQRDEGKALGKVL